MKKHAVVILLATLLILIASSVVAESTEILAKASGLIGQKKYETAFKLLNEYDPKDLDPDVVARKVDIALSYYVENIMLQMFAFVDLKPTQDIEEMRGGNGKYNMYLFDPVKVLEPLIRKYPQKGILYKTLADYYRAGDMMYGDKWLIASKDALKLAEDNYTKAEKLMTLDWWTLSNMGVIELTMERYDLAVNHLAASVKLNNKDGNTHYNLAYAYVMLNRKEEALSECKLAIGLYDNPGYKYDAIVMAGRLSKETGRGADAIKYFLDARAQNAKDYRTLDYLMNCYLSKGDVANASKYATMLFDMYPTNPSATEMITNDFMLYKMPGQLAELLEALAREYGDNHEALGNIYFTESKALYNNKKKPEAKQKLLQAKKEFLVVFKEDNDVFKQISNLQAEYDKAQL